MKKQALGAMAMLVLAFIGTTIAFGETTFLMRVKIPFEFLIEGRTLPAGEYSIEGTNIGTGGMLFRSLDGKVSAIVNAFDTQTYLKEGHRAEVIFNKYGDTYFLSSVWPDGGETGKQLPRSKLEREHVARFGRAGGQSIVASNQ